MDSEMKKKLQAVLDRVKEPETNLSIADLGLVERIRHHPERRKLTIFTNPIRPAHACCTIIAGLLLSTTMKNLATELEKEFPELSVELAK
jgi:metal-sulfur cluster biosynthetic enzyme